MDATRLDKIAKACKFLIRTSKITPTMFLDMLFYGIDTEVKSLRLISQNVRKTHLVEVTKQAIDSRFGAESTCFVKQLLAECLSTQVSTDIESTELHLFKTVRIKDSTTFDIHPSLANVFEGFGKGGGRCSKAGVSIQYEFDIKGGKILDIDLQSAVSKDSADAISKKEDINKNDLIIRDLGYYSDVMIEQFIERGAFFISKLYHNVSVRLNQDDEKIDFNVLYRQMKANEDSCLDINVYIGKKKRPVRLIVQLVPEQIYEQRVRQRNKENKSAGYATSDEFKARARFNLHICNIATSDCSNETILKLYRIRWQIELVFKIWKSIMHIDVLPKMKRERFLTTLYLKLLWVFINWNIISNCRNYFYRTSMRLLSPFKCFQTMKEMNIELRKSLLKQKDGLGNTLEEILDKLSSNHWVEKRKKRFNFEDIIELIFCKTDI